jgi:cytochrome c1
LLTGYHEPPAGVEKKEGLHYNPYFNGSWIGMAKALYDDIIEYSDGINFFIYLINLCYCLQILYSLL